MTITYGSFISEERIACGDLKKYTHDEQVGDGTAVILISSTPPMGTATLSVKISGTVQTEGTAFTTDYERGIITFVSAPSSGATITADYQRVNLTDTTWTNIINDTIVAMSPSFFKEKYSTGATATTANSKTYAMETGCIELLDVWINDSGQADGYQTLHTIGYNWRFSKDENKLIFGNPYPNAGKPFQFQMLKAYDTYTASGSTIDVQDRYKTILQYGVRERYWQHRLQERVNMLSAAVSERTTVQLDSLVRLVDFWGKKYESEVKKLKPPKPAIMLRQEVRGMGKP